MTENSRCLAVAGGRWENLIPEWNDLVFGFWQRAAVPSPARRRLRAVINTDPVTIKDIELRIIDPDTAGSPRSGHR